MIQKLVITSAQNRTPVCKKGLKSLEVFCEHNKAELVVLPFIGKDKDLTWHPALNEYLQLDDVTKDFHIGNSCQVVTSLPINYQNLDPVAGIENLTADRSCIVPGTKLRMKVVPVKSNKLPKVLLCPGAITKPNYRDNRAGYLASTHHSVSALYIETDGSDTFHFRQLMIHPEKGFFYDLDKKYTHKGVYKGSCLALVMGDVHVPNQDIEVMDATFVGARSLYSITKPENIILHDLLDFESASHHHVGNKINYFKAKFGLDDVEAELDAVTMFLSKLPKESNTYVVSSNHNDHLSKWLDGEIPLGINQKLWHQLNFKLLDRVEEDKSPLELFVESRVGALNNVEFLNEDSSLMVGGYELAIHGHKGANGAKGSLRSFCTAGIPTIIGHAHTPQLMNGSIVVGTNSKLDMGYNRGGLSSWLHSSCLVYPYGATLINFIEGKWRF
jgi:hypothetical protein